MPMVNNNSPRRPWMPERKAFGGMRVNNQRFYNSKAWRDCATAHKVAHFWQCKNVEVCGGVAKFTNHNPPLIQLIQEGKNPYDWEYLEDLCESCNASVTGKQGHKTKQ